MQMDKPMSLPYSEYGDHHVDQSDAVIGFEFNRLLQLDSNDNDDSSSRQLLPDLEVHAGDENHGDCADEEEEEEEDDNDDDFTFVFTGGDDSPIPADKMFEDGQIRPVFPLFDQNLLLNGDYEVEEIDRHPKQLPVDNVFIESPLRSPSSTAAEHEENDGAANGPYCDWSKQSVGLSKKSNSTGFSKLWRLRDKVGRSNSDGRDTFVFLKTPDRTTTATTATTSSSSSSSSSTPAAADRSFVKVNAAGGKATVVKKGTKVKKAPVSAHEAYLRSKGGHADEERRRSYLPYRPELMGFFTNVHGGLSKNVHPY